MGKIAFYCENHTKYIDVCTVGKNTGGFHIGVGGAYCSQGLIKSYLHCVARGDIRCTVNEYLSIEVNGVYLSSLSVK
jgi:hypothetical protein